MKDLKKVQEFFSKPIGEGYYEFDMEDEGPDYNSISSLEDELRRLIRFSNQYGSKGADAKIEQLKQRIAQLKNQVNEAQEDPTDIIAMDVPLFLRMLEWAKEEAAEDVDLHEVTERAIEAVKLRGLLSMEDYQDLIGEPIEEETGYSKYLVSPENPEGETQGLTSDEMSNILMKIAKGGYYEKDEEGNLNKVEYDEEIPEIIKKTVKEVLLEKKKKRDRCLRIADRKFDKPSAYKSAAASRCRQGEIWQDLK